jgi:predicted dehydrogenase
LFASPFLITDVARARHNSKGSKLVIKIGVIGYGYWGPNLVRNFAEYSHVQLKSVADTSPQKLELVQRRFPALKITADYHDLLKDPELDAIAVATPVSTHFELGMAVLKSGKHLWLEKPMAETSLQARQLLDQAEKRKLVLFVDHTFVYTGAVRKMRDIVASGDLGKILYYDSSRVNLGLFQHDVNVIADLGVHDFSILDHLLRQHPIAVSAGGINHFPGTPENLAYITMFYDSGTIAHINVSWLAPVKVRQILLGGSNKMITYDDLQPSEKVKVYDKGVSFTDDPKKIYEMRVGYRTGDMWAPKLDETEALRLAVQEFATSIEQSKSPETDGWMGLRVVELVEAATSSMRGRGETVHTQRKGSF